MTLPAADVIDSFSGAVEFIFSLAMPSASADRSAGSSRSGS